jgi:hypothetical protein
MVISARMEARVYSLDLSSAKPMEIDFIDDSTIFYDCGKEESLMIAAAAQLNTRHVIL